MKRNKSILCITLMLILTVILTACGSKDSTGNSEGTSSASGDSSNTAKDSSTTDEAVTPIAENQVALGDLDAEDLKVLPAEKVPSMYYYDAGSLINEVFMPEQDDKIGLPYVFNGTVMEEYASIVDYLAVEKKHGPDLVGLDTSSKGYKIMTKLGPVIMIDVLPYQIKFIRESGNSQAKEYLNGSLTIFDYYDSWYNELKKYTEFPEVGNTNSFYGFYLGYDEKNECPVFTYGVSELARVAFAQSDYLKFRNDKLKKYKYYNNFTFEYPVGWSTALKKSERVQMYLPENGGSIAIQDFNANDMSLDDVVSWYLGETPDPDMEYPPDYNVSDFLRIKNKEKILINDGTESAYHIDISYKYDVGWIDEVIYAFKSKSSIIIIECYINDYSNVINNESAGENTDSSNGNTMTPEKAEQLTAIFKEEFDNMINSIKLITTY